MTSLNGTQASGKAHKKGKKGKGRVGEGNGSGRGRDEMSAEERIAAERIALLAEKQTEMEGVLDRHDTLVRESFHLEKFTTMLLYDPTVAKTDSSAVWREYKEKHDLLEQAPSVAGPSTRTTRRAHTERLQQFKAQTMDASPSSSKVTYKSSGKAPAADPIWSIIAGATGKEKQDSSRSAFSRKGKGKERADPTMDDWNESISQAGNYSTTPTQSSHRRPKGKRMSADLESTSANGLPVMFSARKKRRKEDGLSQEMPPPSAPPARSSRRLREDMHHSVSKPLATTSTALTSPSPIKSSITRIKLIVRRPPPHITNPRQRPPAPRFNSSVEKFLASYTTINDQDYPPQSDALHDLAQSDGLLLDRVDSLRAEGRLLPQGEPDDPESDDSESMPQPTNIAFSSAMARNPDLWDQVVEEAIARRRNMKRTGGSRYLAAQVASKIKSYWDGNAQKEDKAKAQEERRLRLLAKATIKLVTAEWRKAVFHIREQERLAVEAEERRIGQSHLDAILDQSGHILETQQGDLTKGDDGLRSRSQSSSASATMYSWGVDSDDEDEEGEGSGSESPASEVDENEGAGESQPQINLDYDQPSGELQVMDGDDADIPAVGDSDCLFMATPRSAASTVPEESDLELQYPSDGSMPPDTALGSSDAVKSISPDRCLDASEVSHLGDVDHPNLDPSSPSHSSFAFANMDEQGKAEIEEEEQEEQEEQEEEEQEDEEGSDEEDEVVVEEKLTGDMAKLEEEEDTPEEEEEEEEEPPPGDDMDVEENVVKGPDDMKLPDSRALGHTEGDVNSPIPPIVAMQLPQPDRTEKSRPPGSSLHDSPMLQSPTVVHHTSLPIENLTENSLVENDHDVPAEELRDDQARDDIKDPEEEQEDISIPQYLQPYAVAPVKWDPESKVRPPILLRGTLRPYQQSGLEWLASLHTNNLNGILADEMGLGKTIQTISLLAHLACDQGIWGPHLIIVPTSVLLNWEMEFKKFLPGFNTLSYHGTTKRRKELRQGWNDKNHFNVCITSYTLASRDSHIFKRKAWYYMILDEAHMIKNFKSQRWNILLMFRSFRRLLLTGTPLQNNLTELWALLQFLMSGTNFANLKEFGEWFSNPLEKAIEMGTMLDEENLQRVSKLHTVLRPYLLRRLKRDVEKELPSKYNHLVLCPLSKRQRFLYDEFMLRAGTRESLQSGVYQKIANILMQLRKVCNHPDLFEVRPIVTSFAMTRSAIADFEISELMVRRRLLAVDDSESINLDLLGLRFIDRQGASMISALGTQSLDASPCFPSITELTGEPPRRDTRSIAGFREFTAYQHRAAALARWTQAGYLNRLRCNHLPIYGDETLSLIGRIHEPLLPLSAMHARIWKSERVTPVSAAIKSYHARAEQLASTVDRFAFVTPAVVALDMPRLALLGHEAAVVRTLEDPSFDQILHQPSVKLQIAFPDPSLLQFDCGKLQKLTSLLREKKARGHRVLIFTQMTKILDILEIFLNFHGYLYLRLDGATKIEDRQYITERFNADARVFCFIASSRSGGVGINLTGADTVVFYDSDFNPQMDRQCEDRAHRIGQIRDVHIYRFVSSHTVEEAMLLKANQKRSLDDLVIQKGEFDWRSLFGDESTLSKALDETALTQALGEVEDTEDAHAAAVATREANVIEGADEADFGESAEMDTGDLGTPGTPTMSTNVPIVTEGSAAAGAGEVQVGEEEDDDDDDDEGGTTVDYMLAFVRRDEEFFQDWRI